MKIDLHCHTEVSPDCLTPLALIPPRCLEQDIRIQAITDHDQVRGAQELQQMVRNDSDLEM
ncbi:MAG TPA: PHP domain-containing protein, partial [Candidatus Binatia bacterium]|nr:PHP domain-containing protein [Candidatus Binatia bacterium]